MYHLIFFSCHLKDEHPHTFPYTYLQTHSQMDAQTKKQAKYRIKILQQRFGGYKNIYINVCIHYGREKSRKNVLARQQTYLSCWLHGICYIAYAMYIQIIRRCMHVWKFLKYAWDECDKHKTKNWCDNERKPAIDYSQKSA